MSTTEEVRQKFQALRSSLNERMRRLWAGAEAESMGHGGVTAVAQATGLAISTVRKGRDELREGAVTTDLVTVRRKGAGRPKLETANAELLPTLQKLVDPSTRGDPESPLCWTCKSTRALSRELEGYSFRASDKTVANALRTLGFSLQAPKKTVEGAQHPDRNTQFEYINKRAADCMKRRVPFISVDTKKKELVGNFKNGGVEWQPKATPELVDVHDFADDALGKAIPYGVFDVVDNSAFVNVGTDHDTPIFAVASIEAWWKRLGSKRYPGATELFITADAGGSNGYRLHVWKFELQRLADKLRMAIHVSHFPPGTSKWNKIEHRLFSFITMNWRGRPLRTYETVVNLIANTTNSAGLVVHAKLDRRCYPIGKRVTPEQMRGLSLERDEFHGDWNYTLRPR